MMRRVLVVSEPMEYGVLSYLERLFEGLDMSRWQPALAFSPHRMAPQGTKLVATLVERRITVCSLSFRRAAGAGDARAAWQLLAAIRRFRPDIVHLHSTKAGVIGRVIARTLPVSVLYTPHGTSWEYTGPIMGRVQLLLERALRRATSLLLAVCAEEARTFVEHVGFPRDRVRVIRNGVRVPEHDSLLAARARARAAYGMSPGEVWLLFVGRLTDEKGLDVLLRGLETDPVAHGLLVVGDGPERARLEAAASRARIPVRFCGYQEDVSHFLAAADVFVQPSRSEGLPFTVLEAMAHRLPVVCSRVGGIESAVAGCGRVVAPDDPVQLAACLQDMSRDARLRRALGDAGRARVAREFSTTAMLSALHDAYDEAYDLGRRGRLPSAARAA